MHELNELVYQVSQRADLLQQILLDPSFLTTHTSLNSEQINAFMAIVNDSQLFNHLQDLTADPVKSVFWRKPWGGIAQP